MQACFKVWLEVDGELALSNGRAELLREIDHLGSISSAARVFGMSYRAAWDKLHSCEQKLGFKLLETQSGGKGGGGAQLTPEAKEFLAKFDTLRAETENKVNQVFSEVFGAKR